MREALNLVEGWAQQVDVELIWIALLIQAEVFGSDGASASETVEPHDLRFMYGFWHVPPRADRGPRDDGAEGE